MGFDLPLLNRRRRIGGFSPQTLFALSEPGFWYDPSDLNTLFKDTAGTQPVTTPGDTVALMLDKSGRGNHATQSTTANRPTYGIVPKTGRRNLLTFTEQFDNAVWTKGGAITVATNAAVAPDGTTTAGLLNSPGFNQGVNQSFVATSTTQTVSVYVRAGSTTATEWGVLSPANSTLPISGFQKLSGPGTLTDVGTRLRVSGLTSDWTRFSITYSGLTVGTTYRFLTYVGLANPAASLGNIYAWGAQLEVGSTATAYQRVTTQFDVTKAGVASDHYLFFGGSTDPRWMITPTITPGTDKVQVFAGVRKLSDAASALIVEHGTGFQDGSFAMFAPNGNAVPGYSIYSKGTVHRATAVNSGYPAPISNVLSFYAEIPTDTLIFRANGSQIASSLGDQGTGNYLAYQTYIGTRGSGGLRFNGQLFQLITRFGPNLPTPTTQQTERFVAEKTPEVTL